MDDSLCIIFTCPGERARRGERRITGRVRTQAGDECSVRVEKEKVREKVEKKEKRKMMMRKQKGRSKKNREGWSGEGDGTSGHAITKRSLRSSLRNNYDNASVNTPLRYLHLWKGERTSGGGLRT